MTRNRTRARTTTRTRAGISTICGIAVLTLVCLTAYFFCPPARQPDFAPGVDVKVFLPQAGSNQLIRYERYHRDRITRSLTEIEYLDGNNEKVFYSSSNIRTAATKYFPPDANGSQQIKSRARYDHNRGLFFTSHQVYRSDGTLERSGLLLIDGNYQSRYYFADGKTLARERLFNQKRAFLSETLYSEDGTVVTRINQSQSDQKEVLHFWPSGALKATYRLNVAGGAKGQFFNEDGTVSSEFSKSYWNTSETYFTATGKVWQRRLSYSNNLSIRIFNDDGVLTAQQVWRLRPANGDKAAFKMLDSVSLFKTGVLRPYRTITMDRSGHYVESVKTISSPTVTRILNPDGVVISVQVNDSKGFYSGAPRTPEEAFEQIDTSFLSEPAGNVLPELIDKDSPRLEYDYD